MRDVRKGGVLVAVPDAKSAALIQNSLQLKKEGIRVKSATGKRPRILFYDVPSELTSDEVRDAIYQQNFAESVTKKDFSAGFSPLFKIGPSGKDSTHGVVECSSAIRLLVLGRESLQQLTCS